jgi:hypothetical protein
VAGLAADAGQRQCGQRPAPVRCIAARLGVTRQAELMGRMGHSTTRAALIYQHHTAERDRLIAAAISQIVETEMADSQSPSGTQRARKHPDAS